jgi:hypothetical protein
MQEYHVFRTVIFFFFFAPAGCLPTSQVQGATTVLRLRCRLEIERNILSWEPGVPKVQLANIIRS